MTGTRLGRAAIQNRISALEYYRKFSAEDNPDCVEAQQKLRDNPTIIEMEKTVKRNTASRVISGHIMKASGSSSGTSYVALFCPLYFESSCESLNCNVIASSYLALHFIVQRSTGMHMLL